MLTFKTNVMKIKYMLFILLFFALNTFSQTNALPEGWDEILLEGKTAYMNLVTGEVSKTKPTKPALKPVEDKEFDPTLIHVVKKGESLSTIARSYGFGLAKLYQLNSMSNFDKIEIGQEVVVGYAHNEEEKEAFLKGNKKILAHGHDEKENHQEDVSTYQYHTVAEGETLYRIAVNYKMEVEKIKKLNKLTDNNIYIGQKLRVK